MTNGNESIVPYFFDSNDEPGMGDKGLTKREYFAARAMQGLVSAANNGLGVEYDTTTVATNAVEMADALIEALNK